MKGTTLAMNKNGDSRESVTLEWIVELSKCIGIRSEKAEVAKEVKEAEKAEVAEEADKAEKAEVAEEADETGKAEVAEEADEAGKAEGAEETKEAEKAEGAKEVDKVEKAENAKKVREAEKAEETQEARQAFIVSEDPARQMKCRYCKKPVSTGQRINFFRKLCTCRECRVEAVSSKEDAEKVIDSCLYVLAKIYGIEIRLPVSVEMHEVSKGSPVKIEGINQYRKEQRKKAHAKKSKNQATVEILHGTPRFLVIEGFIKECFQDRLERVARRERAAGIKRNNSTEVRVQDDEKKIKGSEYSKDIIGRKGSVKLEMTDDAVTVLSVWFTANCMYNMGELIYAERYIADFQANWHRESMKEIYAQLPSPWSVSNKSFEDKMKEFGFTTV